MADGVGKTWVGTVVEVLAAVGTAVGAFVACATVGTNGDDVTRAQPLKMRMHKISWRKILEFLFTVVF